MLEVVGIFPSLFTLLAFVSMTSVARTLFYNSSCFPYECYLFLLVAGSAHCWKLPDVSKSSGHVRHYFLIMQQFLILDIPQVWFSLTPIRFSLFSLTFSLPLLWLVACHVPSLFLCLSMCTLFMPLSLCYQSLEMLFFDLEIVITLIFDETAKIFVLKALPQQIYSTIYVSWFFRSSTSLPSLCISS